MSKSLVGLQTNNIRKGIFISHSVHQFIDFQQMNIELFLKTNIKNLIYLSRELLFIRMYVYADQNYFQFLLDKMLSLFSLNPISLKNSKQMLPPNDLG